MAQNKFDTIISDLGNVLINFDHGIAVKKILQHTPKKEEDIYDLFFDSPLTGLYEEGKITPDEFFQRVKEFLELDTDRDSFFHIWNDIFFEMPENLKMQKLLLNVKKDHKLIMISNLNETHFEFLKPKMPIFKKFDKLILSYEAGLRKPAPGIYKMALDAAKTVPSRALYVDDRKDLIEAAEKLGIRGIVFDSTGRYKIPSCAAGDGLEGAQAPLPRGYSERNERHRGMSPCEQVCDRRELTCGEGSTERVTSELGI